MKTDFDKPILIAPKGTFDHPAGDQVIDMATLIRLQERINEWARDLVVDYEHESLNPAVRAPAAGWVKWKTLKIVNEGLVAIIDWTNEAKERIASKQYRYLSPVFEKREGKITALYNLGLTNNPNINSMPPLTNQFHPEELYYTMETNLKERIKNELGLDPDADDRLAIEALETLFNLQSDSSLVEKLGASLAAIGLTNEATDEMAIERIAALANETAILKKENNEQLINDAIASGRLAPRLKSWAISLSENDQNSLSTFIANQNLAAPLGGLVTKESVVTKRLDDLDEAVCKSLGITPEEFLAYS